MSVPAQDAISFHSVKPHHQAETDGEAPDDPAALNAMSSRDSSAWLGNFIGVIFSCTDFNLSILM
jgi:hypothetical protein